MISRSTDDSGSNSEIRTTLISLWSCFFTCSTSGASTTMVIRDMPSSAVGPTASEWMLNPLLASNEETRASTPGLSSTMTERMWCIMRASGSQYLSTEYVST